MQRLIFIALLGAVISCSQTVKTDTKLSALDQRVDSLLTRMTLEEKIGQTNMYSGTWDYTGPVPQDRSSLQRYEDIKAGRVGSMLNVVTAEATREAQELAVDNSRLGIPLLFGYDVIHGYQTMFPIPLAQASSWDREVAQKCASLSAAEAAASGIHWTFAPMVDISRDARWGRIMESPGEDPFLGALMAAAWVKGFQGDDLADVNTLAACAKHFAGYGYAEAGRDYNSVDVSQQTLYNVILPPFKAAKDAGVATFMSAFNDLNGVPATANESIMQDVLREQWKFEGIVVSDWGSIGELIDHGFAADSLQAATAALRARTDIDMESVIYVAHLKQAINQGKIDEAVLDEAVRSILKLKFRLGLFEDPYRYCDVAREKEQVYSEENRSMARELARQSMVLLKNEKSLLPLSDKVNSVAVIGQLANHKDVPLGNWRAQAIKGSAISLVEGIREKVGGGTRVDFSEGYQLVKGERSFGSDLTFADDKRQGFADAIELARKSDVVIYAIGEDCFQSGEGRSQVDIALKGNQVELLQEIKKVNSNVVVVLMTGRPVAIPEVAAEASSILLSWYAGSESGNAIADVLFGDHNPSGKLPVSFPYHTGQEPLYYSRKSTGRPVNLHDHVFWSHYTDSPNEALFPFGFGLSYTTFNYGQFKVNKVGDNVEASVQVTNTGAFDGEEVVQLYIQDVAASLTRPILELKGFEKAAIAKGASQAFHFVLSKKDLSFFNNEGELIFEPGEFIISVGPNSRDVSSKSIVLE